MGAWVVVSVIAGGMLALVLLALFRASPMTRREPRRPAWSIPTPAEVRDVRFPLALQGYDPEQVDVTLVALAEAYEALYLAAGPATIARATERLEGPLPQPEVPTQTA